MQVARAAPGVAVFGPFCAFLRLYGKNFFIFFQIVVIYRRFYRHVITDFVTVFIPDLDRKVTITAQLYPIYP